MNRYVRALGAGVLVAAFNVSGVACSSTTVETPTTTEPSPKSADYSVQTTMRQTWGDEASLTRIYLIEELARLPDASFARERLLQSEAQVGDLIATFYRPNISNDVNNLLRERTEILLDYAAGQRVHDEGVIHTATTRLRANEAAMATLLSKDIVYPIDLEKLLGNLLRAQGESLQKEVAARIAGDFRGATTAHETFQLHVGIMADTLGDVAVTTRPDLVAQSTLSPQQRELYKTMNDLWRGHESLTREWLVSAVAGLPDATELMNELLHNQVALGDTLRTYYGGEVGNGAAALFATHVILVDGYVGATKANDRARMAAIQQQLYDNADAIGALLMGANPYWTDIGGRIRNDVDHTLNQVTARVFQDWKLDLASYDLAVNDGQKIADVMASGMIKQGVGGFH